MKKEVVSNIITIVLFVISLIGLAIFAFQIIIWLDISVFGLQDPEFTAENNALFSECFTKMTIAIGGNALFLIILFVLNFLGKNHHKKYVMIPLLTLIEMCLISAIIITFIFELNFDLISSISLSKPVFYLSHLPLLIAFATSMFIYIKSLLNQLKLANNAQAISSN